MEDNVQDAHKTVLNSLKVFGYFDSPLFSHLYTSVYFASSAAVVLGLTVGFVNRDTIHERLEIVYCTNAILFTLTYYVMVRRNQKQFRRFFSNIFEAIPKNDDLRLEALRLALNKARKVLPTFIILSVGFVPFIVLAWCFLPLFLDLDYNNKNLYIIPYLFRCPNNGENRFALTFLCIKSETFVEFLYVSLLISLVGLWDFAITVVWQVSFLSCVYIFVGANVKVIRKRLRSLNQTSSCSSAAAALPSPQAASGNESKTSTYRTEFIKVIEYHQYLYGTMKIVIPLLETFSNLFLGLCIMNVSIIVCVMGKQFQIPGYWAFQIKTLALLFNWLSLFFMNTYCAEVVSKMQLDINTAVYSIQWYEQNVEFRKLIFQFQLLLQKPFQPKSFGIFSINRILFANVIRISYRALNLLLAQFNGK